MAQPLFKSAPEKSGISATVWKNDKNGKVSYSVAVQRSWIKKDSEEWQHEKIYLFVTENGESWQLSGLIKALTEVKAFLATIKGGQDHPALSDPDTDDVPF